MGLCDWADGGVGRNGVGNDNGLCLFLWATRAVSHTWGTANNSVLLGSEDGRGHVDFRLVGLVPSTAMNVLVEVLISLANDCQGRDHSDRELAEHFYIRLTGDTMVTYGRVPNGSATRDAMNSVPVLCRWFPSTDAPGLIFSSSDRGAAK